MESINQKIFSFQDIDAWQEGHKLVLLIYQITKSFPRDELFGITSQMRRASVSITSNIAEGFGRHGYKEKIHFYYYAKGSLIELQNQLMICHDIGYINPTKLNELLGQSTKVHKIINGLIKKSKTLCP